MDKAFYCYALLLVGKALGRSAEVEKCSAESGNCHSVDSLVEIAVGVAGRDVSNEESLHLLQRRAVQRLQSQQESDESRLSLAGQATRSETSEEILPDLSSEKGSLSADSHAGIPGSVEQDGSEAESEEADSPRPAAAAPADASKSETSTATKLLPHFRKLAAACHSIYGNPGKCSDGIVHGADDVFHTLMSKSSLQGNLTEDERIAFGERFKNQVGQASKSVSVQTKGYPWERYSTWKALVVDSFKDMRPAASQALAKVVEEQKDTLGWEARYDPALANKSLADLKKTVGLEPTEDEKEELMKSLADGLKTMGRWDFQPQQEPQGPFDIRDRWPECREVMSHVRFQDCNNCWSHAAAYITEAKICMLLHGQFHGRDAWLSQSYVAACRPDGRDYCDAGGGTLGFKTINLWGLPTGAPNSRGSADPGAWTCYPQLPPGMQGVACPSSCSRLGYPRDLRHDTFFPSYGQIRALHPWSADAHYETKMELMQEGPVLMGFTAYQDLQLYRSGIYRPSKSPDNKSIGGHAVTIIGFGPGYYLCMNSWGPNWGDRGTFRLAPDVIDIGFYLPGKLSFGRYGRFPVPIP